MKRYIRSKGTRVEDPKVDAFLSEVAAVSRRHGLSLAHEDAHGAFVVEPLREANIDWLMEAMIDRDENA